MATEQTKNINTPGGVQTIKAYVPDEGEMFYDTAEADGVLKRRVGDKLETFDATNYLKQMYGLNDQQFAAKFPTWGSVLGAATTELQKAGLDTSKIAKVNMAVTGDVWKPTGITSSIWDMGAMTGQAAKQTGGDMTAFTSGEARPYTAEEQSKIASGVNGPVTATGEKIAEADYGKYGITDNKITPTEVVGGKEVKIAGMPADQYRAQAEAKAPEGTRYLGTTEFGGLTKEWTMAMNQAGVQNINVINSVIEDMFLQRQGGDIYLKTGAPSIQEAIKKAQDLQNAMRTPTISYGTSAPTSTTTTGATYNISDLVGGDNMAMRNVSLGDLTSGNRLSTLRNDLFSSLSSQYEIPGLKNEIDRIKGSLSTAELAVSTADASIKAFMNNAKLNYESIQNQTIPQGIITGQLAHQQRLDQIVLDGLQGQKELALSELKISQGALNEAMTLYDSAMGKIDKAIDDYVADEKWQIGELLKQAEKQSDREFQIDKMYLQQEFDRLDDEAEIKKSLLKTYGAAAGISPNDDLETMLAKAAPFQLKKLGLNGSTGFANSQVDVAGVEGFFNDYFNTYGGQCGDFTHRISDGVPALGNSFAEKMSKINTTDISKAKAGDVVVFRTDNSSYGHAVVMLNYDPNTDIITTIESNWGGDEKVSVQQRKWSDVIRKDGGIVYGNMKPEIASAISPYFAAMPNYSSYDVSEDITPTDRKKMTAIGLNPNNPDDVMNFINQAYTPASSSSSGGEGLEGVLSKYGF